MSQAARADLVCNGSPVGFESGIPAGWSVQTHLGAVAWGDRSSCGGLFNVTGAGGNAACVSSDAATPSAYDTELRSNSIDLSGSTGATLRFDANYQNFARSDALDLEASIDGGSTWTQLLHWNEDHGGANALPGESVEVDLSAFAGATDLRLRWRYYDFEENAFNWYAQVDGARLLCDTAAVCAVPEITNRLADGGLEGGAPSTDWSESSTNFSTPLCTSASCGFAGARTGDAWAFLGGSEGVAEVSSLEQSVLIDAGIAELEFYLWIPHASGNGSDLFRVLVDGTEVLAVAESATAYRDGYQRVRVNVSSFADGASHVVRFEASVSGAPSNTNFFVDDIRLAICTAVSGQPELGAADIELFEGDAGLASARFVIRLSSPYTSAVEIGYATADGTAVAGVDYTATSGTLQFAPGETAAEVVVPVIGDLDVESSETFVLDLSAPVNADLVDAQAVATILDDDALPGISIGDATVVERAGALASFRVSLSAPSDSPVSVSYATSDGSALAGADYTAAAGSVVFSPGTITQSITVPVLDDPDGEAPETFFVDLSAPSNGVLADAQGLGTIQNDDAPPVLSISNTAVVEGDAIAAQALFTLSLTYASHVPITVDFETGDGTALAGADYAAAAGTATIPAGAESLPLPVGILGDGEPESDETFSVALSSPANATLGSASAIATIVDDDLAGDECFGRELVANGSFEQPPAVGWTAVAGTWSRIASPPLAPVDGAFVGGPGTDAVAELRQDIAVGAYANVIDAGLQEFELSGWVLSGAAATPDATRVVVEYRGADNLVVLGAFDSGDRTNSGAWEEIEDRRLAPAGTRFIRVRLLSTLNDGADNDTFYDAFSLRGAKRPALDADAIRVVEGSGVAVDATFELSLSCSSEADVTVGFVTADLTATAGNDYTATAGSAVFSGGSTAESVIVPVLPDALTEAEETFELLLTAPANVENRAPVVAAVILDAAAPTVSTGDTTVVEGDAGLSDALFPVTLSSVFAHDVAVTFATVDGSARAGADYQATAGTLVIPAGTATAAIAVPVLGDLQAEGDESFDLVLSSPLNGSLANASARATIENDDELARLVAGSASVVEGDAGTVIGQVPVTLTTPLDVPVTARFDLTGYGTAYRDVDFVQVGGPATGGVPIGLPPGTVRIPAGSVSAVIEVEVLSDGLPEGDERVAIVLSAPRNAEVLPDDSIGILTIVDDDSTCVGASLIENPSAEELTFGQLTGWTAIQGSWGQRPGNSPYPLGGNVSFQTLDFGVGVTLFELAQDVDVTAFAAEIASGSQAFVFEGFVRTLDSDASRIVVEYRDAGGTILAEFDSGEITEPFRWEQVTDLRAAPVGTELVRVRLIGTAPTGGGVGALFDALSLRPAGSESLSISGASVFEEDGVASLAVELSCAASGTVTVDFTTVDGTAVAGSDYLSASGTLTFAPGEVLREIEITLVDDAVFEGNGPEDFFVELSNPSGAVLAVPSGRVRIGTGTENRFLDLLPARTREGDAGASSMFFTVFLDRPAPTAVTAEVSSGLPVAQDGIAAATPGLDYVEPSGLVTIPAGETAASVVVQILGDAEDEPAEGFRLVLTNATGAVFASGFGGDSALGTIDDDDGPVSVSISDASRREFDRGLHDLNFTVTLSKPLFDADASIEYSTTDLTAVAGGDYLASAGTVLIPAGATSGVITIQTIANQDWDGEPSTPGAKQFRVDLEAASPSRVVIADGVGIGSVVDDDKYIQRFGATARGGLAFTGNTLGLSRGTDTDPGTLNEIGVFTTTDTNLQVGNYPPGTTLDWTRNSSAAVLDLPVGAEVLHAELIWAGTAADPTDPILETPVTLIGPGGAAILVSPDPITARRSSSANYMRSADVSSFVAEQAGGLYEVGGVFATIAGFNTPRRHAGWTLAVVYADDAEPARNLSLMVGMATCGVTSVLEDSLDLTTPGRRPLSGRMAVSGADGDAVPGETLRLYPAETGNSPNLPSFDVSGPNNPPGQFFSSQLNDGDGLLDTRGTFGDRNHLPGTMTVGGRQGWDITEVDISNTLAPGLSEVALYLSCADNIWPNAFGFEIDAAAPAFPIATKTVDRASAPQGDRLTYSVDLTNAGLADAEDVTFSDPPPPGTTFVPGSFVFNGVPVPSADPAAGVALGTIAAGSPASVSFQVEVDVLPPASSRPFFINQASWTYRFREDLFAPFEAKQAVSNRVSTRRVDPLVASKTVRLFADLDGNGVVTPGDVLRYEISATNNRAAPLDNVSIQDSVPAILEILPASILISQGALVSEEPLVVDVGQLAGLTTATVSFLARVSDGVSVTAAFLSNQAVVSADGLPPVVTDDPVGDGVDDGTETRVLLSPFVPDNRGTLFHLAFMENELSSPLLRLLITGDLETPGVVEVPGVGFVEDFTVTPGEVTFVDLPSGIAGSSTSESVLPNGVRVTSEEEVTVYGVNQQLFSTDAFLGIPTDVAGTHYLSMNYLALTTDWGGEIAVVATEDDTTITVTPRIDVGSHPAGVPFDIELDELDVYSLETTGSDDDLTGLVITSDKPVSVFSGNVCAYVPLPNAFCDHLVEQIPPTNTWGTSFLTTALATRTSGELFRVLARDDDTEVRLDGALVAVLGAGEHVELDLPSGTAHEIETTLPSLLAQFAKSTSTDGAVGDPSMIVIPPSEQFQESYTIATLPTDTQAWSSYVNLVVPSTDTSTCLLDNQPLVATFSAIGASGFSWAQVSVTPGTHTVSCAAPFGIYSYGWAATESYGYAGGVGLQPIAAVEAPAIVADKTDLLAVDEDGDGQVSAGDVLEYRFVIANSGNGVATEVTLIDIVPPDTLVEPGSITTTQGAVLSEIPVQVELGDLAPATAATVVFQVRIADELAQSLVTLSNQGVVTGSGLPPALTDDPDAPGDFDPTETEVAFPAKVSVADTSVVEGDAGTVDAVFAVTLNRPATEVVSVAFSTVDGSALAGQDYQASSGAVTFQVGESAGAIAVPVFGDTLFEGDEAFEVQLSNPVGLLIDDGAGIGVILGDDGNPVLTASKSDALSADNDFDGVASPGDELEYSIAIGNSGGDASGVTLTDLIPAHTAVVAGSVFTTQGTVVSEDPVEVEVGVLAQGATATVTFRVLIDNPVPAGVMDIVNQGVVTSNEVPAVLTDDPDLGGDQDPTETMIEAAPMLVAEKTDALALDADGDAVPSPGDTLRYTVTLLNNGNTSATGVVFTDSIPAHTAVVPGSVATTQGTVDSEDPIQVSVGEIVGGMGSVDVTFDVVVDDPIAAGVMEVVNQGTLTSNELPTIPTDDPDVGGAADPTATMIAAAPDLVVEKIDVLFSDDDGDGIVSPGDELLYQVSIDNVGNTSATALVLTDSIPPSTAVVPGTVQTSQGTVISEAPVQVDLGELAGDAAATVSFRVLIDDPFPATELGVENQASVASAELPDVLSDDPDTAAAADATETEVFITPAIAVGDATATEAGAAASGLVFDLTLSGSSNRAVTVDYQTADGAGVSGAVAGLDYVAAAGSAAFSAGTTSLQVVVQGLDDLVDELDETFALDLSAPSGGTLADAQGVGTILDDDPAPLLSIGDATVTEGDTGTTDAVFDLTLSAPSSFDVAADFATADGSGPSGASAGADYQALAGSVSIPAGSTSGSVTVAVLGDELDEPDETFTVELSNVLNAALADGQGLGTILDDDLPPLELSIADLSVEEGDSGTTDAVLSVSLSRAAEADVTVDYASSDGAGPSAASAGADYQATAGTLTVPAGDTSATIAVPVVGDLVLEDNETFEVELANPSEGSITGGLAIVTILDDELCLGPNLIANPGAEEPPVNGELPSWTEVLGTDWKQQFDAPPPAEGAAYFFAGQSDFAELRQDVEVTAYSDFVSTGDQRFLFEGAVRTFDEIPADTARIIVEYRDASNSVVLDAYDSGDLQSPLAWLALEDLRLAPVGTRWIRIRLLSTRFSTDLASDGYFDALSLRSLRTPVVSVGDVAVVEGDSGTVPAEFPVALSCVLPSDVSIDFATADGSATAGSDYLATTGSVTIPAGAVGTVVSVPVQGDTLTESDEDFSLTVSSPDQVVVVPATGVGLILDNDSQLPPICATAVAEPASLWPPNHKYRGITISGVTDPENQSFTIEVTTIRQDEPVNGQGDGDTSPDGETSPLRVRSERSGEGDGRVYRIGFTATDEEGAACEGEVVVCVPHDRNDLCTDGGPLFDSTVP